MVVVAAGLGSVEVSLIWATHQSYGWLLELYAIEGFAVVAVGALAWDRRPLNQTGLLLCVLGAANLASAAGNVGDKVVIGFGDVTQEVLIASLLHVVVAFPSGRLRSRGAVCLIAAMYASSLGFQVPQYVLGPGAAAFPGWGVTADARLVQTCADVQNWVGAVIIVSACAERVWQLRAERQTEGGQPVRVGVFACGVVTIVFLPFSTQVLNPFFHFGALSLFALQMAVFAWVPFVYALGVLRGGFARSGSIESLGAWLADGRADLGHLRDALSTTVGDPTLELIPWPPEQDRMPEAPRRGRGSLVLEGIEGPLATVSYDAAMLADPGVVRSASQLVAVALERQKLSVEVIASRETVRQSRARIVQAADAERRRLAGDLHDVLQTRLILAALHAGRLAVDPALDEQSRLIATQMRNELQQTISDFRSQLQSLMPAVLIERGLRAAIEELADRLPLATTIEAGTADTTLPPAVATTAYFIVAEAFNNSLKHAHATALAVRLRQAGGSLLLEVSDDGIGGAGRSAGLGLRGVADRVEALGGSIEVQSPEGGGTTLRVIIPNTP